MAEFVQAGLEGMLEELQQLQRVQLLSPEEVKMVIKKRKNFEYKLQKKQKQKEDILSYIQYESSLLYLIGMRRDKSQYMHKKDDIDYAIARRINKLFRILEHRFAADLKIWSSHIAFLIEIQWKEYVSKVYRRMLQVHPDKVHLWISAARFELSQAEGIHIENARTILMEALRFHPKSNDLYLEAYGLELLFVNSLKSDPSKHMVSAETIDAVKEGKIAETMFRKGLEESCSSDDDKINFVEECLKFSVEIEAPEPVVSTITSVLRENFGEHPKTWEVLALTHLNPIKTQRNRSQLDKLKECCQCFEQGLTESPLPAHKQQLLAAYVKTLQDVNTLFALNKKNSQFVAERAWQALQYGKDNNILNLEQEQLLASLNK